MENFMVFLELYIIIGIIIATAAVSYGIRNDPDVQMLYDISSVKACLYVIGIWIEIFLTWPLLLWKIYNNNID